MNMHSIFNPVLFPFPSVSDILWLLKPRGPWWKPHNSFLLQRAIFEVPKNNSLLNQLLDSNLGKPSLVNSAVFLTLFKGGEVGGLSN